MLAGATSGLVPPPESCWPPGTAAQAHDTGGRTRLAALRGFLGRVEPGRRRSVTPHGLRHTTARQIGPSTTVSRGRWIRPGALSSVWTRSPGIACPARWVGVGRFPGGGRTVGTIAMAGRARPDPARLGGLRARSGTGAGGIRGAPRGSGRCRRRAAVLVHRRPGDYECPSRTSTAMPVVQRHRIGGRDACSPDVRTPGCLGRVSGGRWRGRAIRAKVLARACAMRNTAAADSGASSASSAGAQPNRATSGKDPQERAGRQRIGGGSPASSDRPDAAAPSAAPGGHRRDRYRPMPAAAARAGSTVETSRTPIRRGRRASLRQSAQTTPAGAVRHAGQERERSRRPRQW